MTKNYIVFVEQPLKMKLWKIITSKIRGKSFADGISWEPQYNTRFHVVDKHTGQAEYLSLFITKMSPPQSSIFTGLIFLLRWALFLKTFLIKGVIFFCWLGWLLVNQHGGHCVLGNCVCGGCFSMDWIRRTQEALWSWTHATIVQRGAVCAEPFYHFCNKTLGLKMAASGTSSCASTITPLKSMNVGWLSSHIPQ